MPSLNCNENLFAKIVKRKLDERIKEGDKKSFSWNTLLY